MPSNNNYFEKYFGSEESLQRPVRNDKYEDFFNDICKILNLDTETMVPCDDPDLSMFHSK
jgi:hypothetical protein